MKKPRRRDVIFLEDLSPVEDPKGGTGTSGKPVFGEGLILQRTGRQVEKKRRERRRVGRQR